MIDVRQSTHLQVPIDFCYDILRQYEGYPRFIEHILVVNAREDGTYHWAASDEDGHRTDWRMAVDEDPQQKRIRWYTLEERGTPRLQVIITLHPHNNQCTLVEVELIHDALSDVFKELFFNFKDRAEQWIGQSLENYRELTESLAQQAQPIQPARAAAKSHASRKNSRAEKPSIIIGPGPNPTEL